MAYIVARPAQRQTRSGRPESPERYEIRESISTPSGPRARTLATFRTLTEGVIAEAASRARRPFDASKVRARAAALAVPRRSNEAAASATALVARLRLGESLPPVLVNELRRTLPRRRREIPDSLATTVEWIGVDDPTRGRALRDLLDVADRIPSRPRPAALSFPRLSSSVDP